MNDSIPTQAQPDPEVEASHHRRTHTIGYKIRVIETVASLRESGQGAIGAFLRKEGLYYSMVRRWEKQQAAGVLVAKTRGPKQKGREAILEENKKLRRKIEQLEHRLAKMEMIVDLQKKFRRCSIRCRTNITRTPSGNDQRLPRQARDPGLMRGARGAAILLVPRFSAEEAGIDAITAIPFLAEETSPR
jgi:transposase